MSAIRFRRRRNGSRRGQALVEFAIVLPIFLLILMILVDFGRVVYAQHTINQDAAEAARVGAVSADSLTASPDTFTPRYAAIRAAATRMAPAVPMNVLNTNAASIKGQAGACSAVVGVSPAMPNDGTTAACFYPNGTTATGAKIVVKIDVTVPIITPIISQIVTDHIDLHAESSQLLQ